MWDWCQGVKEFYSPVMVDATSDICSCELTSYSCDIIITLCKNYPPQSKVSSCTTQFEYEKLSI